MVLDVQMLQDRLHHLHPHNCNNHYKNVKHLDIEIPYLNFPIPPLVGFFRGKLPPTPAERVVSAPGTEFLEQW